MQFFIDTANLTEIANAKKMGLIDGVTTNPSLMAKEKGDAKDLLKQICEIVDGPISAEVISTEYDGMVKEGLELAAIHKNIVIKVPLTMDGLKACKTFFDKGIRINVTLVFSANQALLAAKCGATYVSPFIGRLDDIGQNGMQLIADIKTIFDNYKFKTQILAASIRHADHVRAAAMAGSHVATIPFKVIEGLAKHPLTDLGLAQFLKDHAQSQGKK
ncbi:MAG: fructose-6-phosphate aldolase [Bacteriovoracaceae bacterium]|nr:fructose-6-phosphate aldolase [Bacteriovoracaceae bacterium]